MLYNLYMALKISSTLDSDAQIAIVIQIFATLLKAGNVIAAESRSEWFLKNKKIVQRLISIEKATSI